MIRTKAHQANMQSGAISVLRRYLGGASNTVVRLERTLMGVLIAAMFFLVFLNLLCRTLGWAIYWADELAIYLMIWAVMVGASISVKLRTGIAVQLWRDRLPDGRRSVIATLVDGMVLLSALCLLIFSWIWYDPVDLVRHGFNLAEFKSATFNFIYEEPTVTLQIHKFWVWMIMPLFALSATLHSATNLVQSISGQKAHPDTQD